MNALWLCARGVGLVHLLSAKLCVAHRASILFSNSSKSPKPQHIRHDGL